MTVKFECNGPDCGKLMLRDDWRIKVGIVEATTPIEPVEFDPMADPEAMLEGINVAFDVALVGDLWEGELHFCSWSCYIMHGWQKREEETATHE